jgi:hypothetical protein
MPHATDELHAAAATRRELGPSYDEAVLLSLAERLERKRDRSSALHEVTTVVVALGSIGLGVLVVAAAQNLGALGGTVATLVAWLCIAAINIAHARRR